MKGIVIMLLVFITSISPKLLDTISGGSNNLEHRFRPSWGEDKRVLSYKDLDRQTIWFVDNLQRWLSCPDDLKEMYLYGSRSNDTWWFSSDFDIGLNEPITDDIKKTVEACKNQFKIKVNIEINQVYPLTDKRLIKVER